MPEPLAVAFVEIRPDVDEFRANAEQELRTGVGDDIDVRGRVQLDGLQEARQDVSGLTRDLRGVSGTQLQFEGLEQATGDARLLAGSLRDAAAVDLVGGLRPAADAASDLAAQAALAASSVSGIPSGVAATQLSGDIGLAAEQTAVLSTNSEVLGSTLNDAATAASGVVDVANLLARSERQLAAATMEEVAAVKLATVEEDRFARVRAARSRSVGPLRFAGIGLGAGVALFAATSALRELGGALEVTGDEADTFQGRMRNFGANLLGGDLVGAFRALGNQARSYSVDAVLAIETSEQLAASLKDAGIALNEIKGLQESRALAAETLTQVPQFLQTQLARAQAPGGGGDKAQLSVLRQAQRDLEEQEAQIGQLNLSQAERLVALEQIFDNQAKIAGLIEQLTKEQRPDILAPLVAAVTNARLTGDQGKILAALRNEAGVLVGVIEAERTNAEDRQKFADALLGVNKDIESIQDEIVAEAQRHQEAMLDKLLDVGVLEDLQVQSAGGSSNAGRSARAAAIQATLDRGTIDGKKLTRDQKERLHGELVSINSEIETEQQAIIDEQKRHADEMKANAERAAAEIEQKLRDADQAFLRLIGNEGRKVANEQLAAAATASLQDDIRTSNVAQATFKRQIAVARKTINDAKLRADTIAGLTEQIDAEERNEKALRQQQRREKIDTKEESLDLDIQLAQANENSAAEIRAHEAKIKFLQERIKHTREGTNQRKALQLEIARERAAIKDLQDDEKEDGGSFDQLAFSFLSNLSGFASNLAGNTMAAGTTRVGRSSSSNFATPPAQVDVAPPVSPSGRPERESGGPSPFEKGRGSGTSTAGETASDLRDSRGSPVNQSQGEEMIHLARRQVRLLQRVVGGLGHKDAAVAKKQAENPVSTSVD